jgi:hypothetical protein
LGDAKHAASEAARTADKSKADEMWLGVEFSLTRPDLPDKIDQ